MEVLLVEIQERPHDRLLHEEGVQLLTDLSDGASGRPAIQSQLISDLLATLFEHDLIDHQEIASCAIGQLKRRYGIDSNTAPAEPLAQSLAQDNLFLSTLRRIINIDPEFEIFLRQARRFLLFHYQGERALSRRLLPLIEALAQQGFNNEYILHEEEDERRAVHEIEAQLEQTFNGDDMRDSELPLLVVGMYRPLASLPFVHRIEDVAIETISKEARAAMTRMIREPLEEKRLSRRIPSFGTITRPTSEAVRAQYEEHPYPRWFTLGRTKALESRLKGLGSEFSWPFSSAERLEILVPGCGTGRHPLSIAAGTPDARVLALDLSKASLAYGQRMAEKLQIRNVTFVHGDLLELSTLGKRFHHIDCIGVLHHLKDPMAGWQVLDQVLLPGGTLHVSVYSTVARMHIEFLRNEIARLQIQPTIAGMKAFRHRLLNDERYRLFLQYLQIKDFFSLRAAFEIICFTPASTGTSSRKYGVSSTTSGSDFSGSGCHR
ncbi:MAG: methyltransferase domain-containing protein [Acidobacteriota bacterium]|nr:methyltransferase domain-containing protein [Acidobacteriota bacterium]